MSDLDYHDNQVPIFRGTRYQIGKDIGTEYRSTIQNYVNNRNDLFSSEFRLFGVKYNASHLKEASVNIANYIKETTPLEWQELQGVADSTNIHINDLIITFGYTDSFDYALKLHGKEPSDIQCDLLDNIVSECSSLIDTKDKVVSIQTWDMPKGSEEFCIVVKKEPKNEPSLFTYGIAGAPCYMGINEFGVCVGTTNLSTLDSGIGLPFPFLISRMLAHVTADKAVTWAKSVHRLSGHYFYILDKDSAYECELSWGNSHIENITNKISHHTNHIIRSNNDSEYCVGQSSIQRKEFIEQLVRTTNTDAIDQFRKAAQQCRLPLCRKANKHNGFNTETVGLISFYPADKKMSCVIGPPWSNSEINIYF
ncbi:MAG: C45 family peptidase [Sedimenticola sp.]